jgi:hypothetical protein
MSNVKAKISNEVQISNEKHSDIQSFDIDLTFGLWHLDFFNAELELK